jgi:hypothetical protein
VPSPEIVQTQVAALPGGRWSDVRRGGRLQRAAVVSLVDERQLRGVVERFDTALPDFVRRTDCGAPLRLRFADVRAVTFLDGTARLEPVDPVVDRVITVRLFDGEAVHGVLMRSEGQQRGVHLAPIESSSAIRWYVPMHAIRDVTSGCALDELSRNPCPIGDPQSARPLLPRAAPAKRIGDILLELGFVSREQLAVAVQVQLAVRELRLGEVMIDMGFTDEKTIGIALALQFQLPFVSIAAAAIDPGLRREVPEALAREWRVLPLGRENGCLRVAVADPTRLDFKNVLRARTGMVINEAVATAADLERAVELYYPKRGGNAAANEPERRSLRGRS